MRNCLIVTLLCMLCFCGCSPYYRVTDPTTDHVYYTRSIKKAGGGSIKLEDKRSGKTVTLQTSEVEELEKEEYNQGAYAE
ncbi:MAG: hypothetical protein ACYSO4_05505 [Planctomycetota bacterium]